MAYGRMVGLSDHQPSDPSHQPSAISPHGPPLAGRIVAAIEVLICSDFLTQFAIAGTLTALGYRPLLNGRLNIGYVVALSLGDAVLLILLILLMLYAHGERPREVLFGNKPMAPEIVVGVPLIVAALIIEGYGSHPKPMIIIFARRAVEVLIDHILAGAFIDKKAAHIGQHIGVAADLISQAAMDANEGRAVEIIRGGFNSGDGAFHPTRRPSR